MSPPWIISRAFPHYMRIVFTSGGESCSAQMEVDPAATPGAASGRPRHGLSSGAGKSQRERRRGETCTLG